jgi:hypothetical protein
MWSYKITSKTVSPSSNPSSIKEKAFYRALNTCRFQVGHRVRIKGTHRYGTVTIINTKYEDCVWKNMRPLFIVVNIDNEGEIICNPFQLKGPYRE